MANATSTQLQELYVAYFGRAADPTGLDYWTESGITQAAFAADMYAQNEFESAYGSKSVEAQVNQIYKNLFDREADVTGLTYWTQQINLGNLKVAEIATHLIWAAQNNSGSESDKTALANRTAAAIAYTAEVKSTTAGILAYQPQSTDPWIAGSNIAEAVTYLSGIDGTTEYTDAGITASVATLTTNGDPTGVGSTFVLTTNTDSAGTTSAANGTISSSFRFTDTGNEVVTGDIGTIQALDVLLDGSSTDSDVMNITANSVLGTFTANRIEKFVVDMAAGTPDLNVTNLTNFNSIEVKGNVAGDIIELDATSKQPTIKTTDYTRVLTINVEQLSGTTTAATAETINVELSGASYGSAAATRSGITITADDGAGTLETLNITSSGDTANDFALSAQTATNNVTLSTVNFLGSTALTTRVPAVDVSGYTLTATAATGDQTLMIDNNGRTTTAINANLFTGFDNIIIKDGTSPSANGDGASMSGLSSGQKITYADDLNASTLTFKGVSGSSDSATIVLDNETASVDVDLTTLNIQNVETLNIESSGKAGTSLSAANNNLINDLQGDATTINITGDTPLDLDLNIDNASSGSAGSRAVTVDASGNTGAVTIETATSTGTGSVSYTITGTAAADTITLANATNAGTINSGAGNDTITSGAGNDTIDLGAGTNAYAASGGTDSVTFGAGVNTITFNEADTTAVAQVSTHTVNLTGWASADTVAVTIGSITKTYSPTPEELSGNGAADDDLIAEGLSQFINSGFTGVSAAHSAAVVTITAQTATDATPTVTIAESTDGNGAIADSTTTTGIDALAVATTITGFKTGTVDDIISFAVSDINATSGITNIDNADSIAVAAADDVVLLNYTVGTSFVDTDNTADGQNVIKVAYSNTINSFANLSSAIDINTITVDAAIADNDGMVTVYYDADDGNMVFGIMQHDNGDSVLDDNLVFLEMGSAAMTQAQYTALGTANFSFVA